VSQLSRDEAERLLERTNGDVCVRLTRRPDGSIVTRVNEVNPPVVPIRLRRAGPVAGAALGLVLGVSGAAYAQEPVENQPVADKPVVVALASKDEVTQTDGAFASVTGTVRRADGRATKALLTLVDTATGQFFSTRLNEGGTFEFNHLPPGEYLLFTRSDNESEDDLFFPEIRRQVVPAGQKWRADVVLDKRVSVVNGGGIFANISILESVLESRFTVFAKVESVTPVKNRDIAEGDQAFRIDLRVTQVVRGESVPERFSITEIYTKGYSPTLSRGAEVFASCREGMEGPGTYARMFFSSTTPSGPYAKLYSEFFRLNRSRVPTREELVEWLVRGTVDPETRLVASHELAAQMEESDFVRRFSSKRPAKDPFVLFSDGPDFLSASQKTRLARALFETRELQERDQTLMDLVGRFENSGFIPFIAGYLRENGETPAEGTGLAFRMLAETTENKRIEDLSRLYAQVEDSNRSDLYFTAPDAKDEKPLDEHAVALEARKRARAELAALIRAALWAYDHPEAP
jgi:hypothetical protein